MSPEKKSSLKNRVLFSLLALLILLSIPAALEISLFFLKFDFIESEYGLKKNPAGLPYLQRVTIDGEAYYEPTRYYRPWGHNFRVKEEKPPGTFRIVCVGGSTANGYSFGNPGAFLGWLHAMLKDIQSGFTFETINCGQAGFPASLVLEVEREVLFLDPDLVIIYSGNNEFFYHRAQTSSTRSSWMPRIQRRLRDLRLVILTHKIFSWKQGNEEAIFSPNQEDMKKHAVKYYQKIKYNDWDRKNAAVIRRRYEELIGAMISEARQRGSKVIICTVASNLKDFEPTGSYHGSELHEDKTGVFTRLVDEGKKAFKEGDYNLAQNALMQAYRTDPESAELNYYLGHVSLISGDTDGAYNFFRDAAYLDVNRDRAGKDLNDIVVRKGKELNTPVSDIETVFRLHSRDGVPGDDLFVDNVHPTHMGHRIIAESLLEIMVEEKMVAAHPAWRRRAREAADKYEESFPDDYLYGSYFTSASLNAFLGRFERSRLCLDRALSYQPGTQSAVELRMNVDDILRNADYEWGMPWRELELLRRLSSQSLKKDKL